MLMLMAWMWAQKVIVRSNSELLRHNQRVASCFVCQGALSSPMLAVLRHRRWCPWSLLLWQKNWETLKRKATSENGGSGQALWIGGRYLPSAASSVGVEPKPKNKSNNNNKQQFISYHIITYQCTFLPHHLWITILSLLQRAVHRTTHTSMKPGL